MNNKEIVSRKQRILIMTDRFPPYSEGGAEISLFIVISHLLKYNYEITVITLNDKVNEVLFTLHNGIQVYSVPYSSSWPTGFWENRSLTHKKPIYFWNKIWRLKSYFDYLMRGRRYGILLEKIEKYKLFSALRKRKLLRYLPIMDEDISNIPSTHQDIKNIIKEFKPDLVHADNFRSILLASALLPSSLPWIAQVRDNRFFCANLGQPMNVKGRICQSCGFECVDHLSSKLKELTKKYMDKDLFFRQNALTKADRVVVTSTFLKHQILSITGVQNIDLVSNPVDEMELSESILSTIRQADPKEILIVGMVNENKGQLGIVRWLDRLSEALVDYRIVIAGRGERLTAHIKNLIASKKYSDRVVFIGYLGREELYRAYARASVVVCPNIWPEPFGRVPLEAGISRRPVVAYAVGGISENIIHGKTGLLVPENDEDALVEAILMLMKNTEYAEMLGKQAYDHIRNNFTVTITADSLAHSWSKATNIPTYYNGEQ
ncbi:glycosyltransferase family 4 protein [Methylophaga sp.]|uniref:glycosyltransferase family 4 protein n=1 Tax=Methylophaga sp. TaxID=2024840 RepID=UPI0027219EB8|nr:glycosyltransferase family 4 protein [Methylophaga sp.]MDO8828414.1 glycosyltransferase family 4 protein [Methylophaga sp.]